MLNSGTRNLIDKFLKSIRLQKDTIGAFGTKAQPMAMTAMFHHGDNAAAEAGCLK
jgi:hypothetical protein